MTRTALFVIAIFAALILAAGCPNDGAAPAGNPPEGYYILIDDHVTTVGNTISGEYPYMWIDFPTYFINTETGVLTTQFHNFEVNESLVVLYGEGHTIGGDYGSGTSTFIYPGYSLPYSQGSFTVEGLTPEGNLQVTFRGQSLTLEPGVPWTETTNRIKKGDYYEINLTSTEQITFYGVFETANIRLT